MMLAIQQLTKGFMRDQMFKIRMGDRLYLAPVGKAARFLDIGIGTEIWAIGMRDDFPDSETLGTEFEPQCSQDGKSSKIFLAH